MHFAAAYRASRSDPMTWVDSREAVKLQCLETGENGRSFDVLLN